MPAASIDSKVIVKPVVIAAGATGLSGVVDLEGYTLMAIYMPAAWVTAAITFAAAPTSDGTFNPVYNDSGVEISIASTVALVNTVISCSNIMLSLAPLRYIKLRSGTVATPVNQTGGATIYLILKG